MLEVTGLRVAYGGIQAVRGITFHVNQGEMVALIGANGAGKTSTLKALSRLLDTAGGSVRYDGQEISRLPPHQLIEQGIALVPEGRGVFPRMSIVENLKMGAYCRRDDDAIGADMEHVFSLFPRLKERALQLAGTLSGGEQQMLAIGRALMSRPKLLLLDEPSMGLAPLMVQKIFEVVCAVAKDGMTVLLVEQNAKLALEVSQRGYVMESGEITLTDDADKLLDNPKVREAYLGE
ncbi:MAG: ABC transporter ATP-binding protein [Propionivibrio sp.]|nr:ABC transporter ATP-binding protein [Propionivibrio sp.]